MSQNNILRFAMPINSIDFIYIYISNIQSILK